jgi:hypothetical protein
MWSTLPSVCPSACDAVTASKSFFEFCIKLFYKFVYKPSLTKRQSRAHRRTAGRTVPTGCSANWVCSCMLKHCEMLKVKVALIQQLHRIVQQTLWLPRWWCVFTVRSALNTAIQFVFVFVFKWFNVCHWTKFIFLLNLNLNFRQVHMLKIAQLQSARYKVHSYKVHMLQIAHVTKCTVTSVHVTKCTCYKVHSY